MLKYLVAFAAIVALAVPAEACGGGVARAGFHPLKRFVAHRAAVKASFLVVPSAPVLIPAPNFPQPMAPKPATKTKVTVIETAPVFAPTYTVVPGVTRGPVFRSTPGVRWVPTAGGCPGGKGCPAAR